MKNLISAAIVLCFLIVASSAQTGGSAQPKMRKVDGQTIVSSELPAVELMFGKDFKYVGGHHFVLYDNANAEQHFYVDADKQGRVKRLYWVQFEGYLPSNTHSYDYKSPKIVKIGGLDFFADAWAINIKTSLGQPDSDGFRARSFLESKGYRLASDEVLTQRLVHLIGDKKRDELMIIYLEAPTPFNLTSTDLNPGGKAESQWPEISSALLARAQKDLSIRQKR